MFIEHNRRFGGSSPFPFTNATPLPTRLKPRGALIAFQCTSDAHPPQLACRIAQRQREALRHRNECLGLREHGDPYNTLHERIFASPLRRDRKGLREDRHDNNLLRCRLQWVLANVIGLFDARKYRWHRALNYPVRVFPVADVQFGSPQSVPEHRRHRTRQASGTIQRRSVTATAIRKTIERIRQVPAAAAIER